jgi:hypothetical protein
MLASLRKQFQYSLVENGRRAAAMKSRRRLLTMGQLGAVTVTLLLPPPSFAFDHPLSDAQVRDAYFLGQDADRSAAFLAKYVQELPVPEKGPHVSQVELSTPYAQVVQISRQHKDDYSAQQAAVDYKNRGDSIRVRVQVMFTPTYPNGGEDFWSAVSVGLVQKTHIAARSASGQAIYTINREGDRNWIIGANVFVVFDLAGVESDSIQVEVIPPGGPPAYATFQLDELK